MADNTATYILENADGYRVLWGCQIENYYKEKMQGKLFAILTNLPCFQNIVAAKHYATEVDRANDTDCGIIVLDRFRELALHELG